MRHNIHWFELNYFFYSKRGDCLRVKLSVLYKSNKALPMNGNSLRLQLDAEQ